jgi:plastocyanin
MVKNTYLHRRVASFSLIMIALCIVLAACGGDSNTATVTTPQTVSATTIAGSTDTPPAPSPTSIPTGLTQTSSMPTPTPTVSRPSPTPTTPKPPPTPTPVPTVVVTITTDSNGNFAFSPQTLNITAGTVVIWKNSTSTPHTVTGNTFGSGTITPGGSFSFKFTQAGTFAYHCMFHPYMVASVIVK